MEKINKKTLFLNEYIEQADKKQYISTQVKFKIIIICKMFTKFP